MKKWGITGTARASLLFTMTKEEVDRSLEILDHLYKRFADRLFKFCSMSEITPESTMQAVLEAYPWAQRALFRHFHTSAVAPVALPCRRNTEGALCERNDRIHPQEVIDRIKQSHDEDLQLWMSPTEVEAAKSDAPCHLVDIRTSEEWDTVHLEASTHMSQESMQMMLSQWQQGCTPCDRGSQGKTNLDAATYFQGQGFTQIRCMEGGIDAWSQQVDPAIPRYRLEPMPPPLKHPSPYHDPLRLL